MAIEPPDQQEERARRRLRPKALVWATLAAGAVSLLLPAGGPWMSTTAFGAVMARPLTWNFAVTLTFHFALAFIYAAIIAAVIYRLPTFIGIVLGGAIGLALYALNFFVFAILLGYDHNEMHVVLAHVFVGLMIGAIYKAASVPPARSIPERRP